MESVDGSKTGVGDCMTLAFSVLQVTLVELASGSQYCPTRHFPCVVFGVGGGAIHASLAVVERRNVQTRYHHSDDRIPLLGYVLSLRAELATGLYPDPAHGLWLPTLALVPE